MTKVAIWGCWVPPRCLGFITLPPTPQQHGFASLNYMQGTSRNSSFDNSDPRDSSVILCPFSLVFLPSPAPQGKQGAEEAKMDKRCSSNREGERAQAAGSSSTSALDLRARGKCLLVI